MEPNGDEGNGRGLLLLVAIFAAIFLFVWGVCGH